VQIDIATLFPGMFREVLNTSILGRARDAGIVDVGLYDIRDFSSGRNRSVDAKPYGGGPGMLLRPGPVVSCVECIQRERGPGRVILMSPQGERFTQARARQLADDDHLIFVCGRYEGFDERIREILSPEEISLGDFVVTGGELPAMMIVDAVVRLLPGALGDECSAVTESFSDAPPFKGWQLLEGPQYTRPPEFRGIGVPEVLTSGDHARIERWREEKSRERTQLRNHDPKDSTETAASESRTADHGHTDSGDER